MSAASVTARGAAFWCGAFVLRVIATLALLSIVALAARADEVSEVVKGQTLRDLSMRGLNGPPRRLAEFRGRPLLINVWASWCGPCRAEMKSLERLAWLDEARYLTVIGISTDDYVENAKAALDAWNSTITHFIDENLALEHMLGASRLPLTVLIDADGRVLEKVYGAREWDEASALGFIHATFNRGQPSSGGAAAATRTGSGR